MSGELEVLRLYLNQGDAGEKQYDIYPIRDVRISSRKDAFSISPPGLAASENILLGVSGMQADITIDCTLWDSGVDRANGTADGGTAITAPREQAVYLENELQAPDFDATWSLNHETGAAFNNDSVFLEEVDVQVFSEDNQAWKECTLRLRRGSSA